MKLTIKNTDFLAVANTVAKAIMDKDPQSKTVLEITNDNKLILVTQSTTTYFKGAVALESLERAEEEQTVFGVTGTHFKAILSVIDKNVDTILIETDRTGKQLHIILPNSEFKLPVFETIVPVESSLNTLQPVCVVSAPSFLSTVQSLTKVVPTDVEVQGHALSCLHISGKDNEITVMGLNEMTIAEDKLIAEVRKPFTALLKPAQANLLNASIYISDTLELLENAYYFGYRDVLGTICLVKKADATPIEVDHFKKSISRDAQVQVEISKLKYALDSMHKLCESSHLLTCTFHEQELSVQNANNDMIVVPISGAPVDVRCVVSKPHLSTILNILADSTVQFNFNRNLVGKGQAILSLEGITTEGTPREGQTIIFSTSDIGE